jgi:ABC-type Fe3+ transport system permease subunit
MRIPPGYRDVFVVAATAAWCVFALSAAYISIDREARRRSPRYREAAAEYDKNSPRWRWWALATSGLLGAALLVVLFR